MTESVVIRLFWWQGLIFSVTFSTSPTKWGKTVLSIFSRLNSAFKFQRLGVFNHETQKITEKNKNVTRSVWCNWVKEYTLMVNKHIQSYHIFVIRPSNCILSFKCISRLNNGILLFVLLFLYIMFKLCSNDLSEEALQIFWHRLWPGTWMQLYSHYVKFYFLHKNTTLLFVINYGLMLFLSTNSVFFFSFCNFVLFFSQWTKNHIMFFSQ